jgi:hypothetical protein
MKKFTSIVEKYQSRGISVDNIEYAIDSVKRGAKREHVIENLTADYRGMNLTDANGLLNELYTANGGEFKKENRYGYLFGSFLLMLGLLFAFYIYGKFNYGGLLVRPVAVIACAICFTGLGLVYIVKALLGKYRDSDEPFRD